jgi:hypothetical protein
MRRSLGIMLRERYRDEIGNMIKHCVLSTQYDNKKVLLVRMIEKLVSIRHPFDGSALNILVIDCMAILRSGEWNGITHIIPDTENMQQIENNNYDVIILHAYDLVKDLKSKIDRMNSIIVVGIKVLAVGRVEFL